MKTRDAQAQAQAERQRAIGAMVEIPGRGYWMDVTEVTLAAYELCVREKGCTQPGTGGECNWGTSRKIHPINCVDWNQAIAFCRWAGKRLPTEQEWQFAAQGPDGRLYPWGNDDPRVQLCWRTSGTCPAGSYASSDSPFGLKDMAGNVWEWTSSKYDAKTRVFRGGSWDNHTPSYVGAAFRFGDDPTYRIYSLGFRCAR
jgi:formylglycine-generating enzyme required for sulfatase activity